MTARRIDIAAVRRLAAAGKSGQEIGRQLGFAGNSVRSFARRHDIALCRESNGSGSESEFWITNGDRALNMLGDGASMSAIAANIGTTKNAVVGRFHRLGLNPAATLWKPSECHRIEFPQPGHCVFPNGDPGQSDFAFCGEQALSGGPYCGGHHRLCYREMRNSA